MLPRAHICLTATILYLYPNILNIDRTGHGHFKKINFIRVNIITDCFGYKS